MYVVSSAGNVPVPGAPKGDVPLGWMSDGSAVLSWDRTLPPRIFKNDLGSGRRELLCALRPADPAGLVHGWLVVSPDGRYCLQRYRRMRSTVVLMMLHG